jgi:glycosyltransferase involved in cell wall biosynthesis
MMREDFLQFLCSFDIYLSASLSDSSPASLIDAMASGLLPVVADIPGVAEWLDSSGGVLFDPGNPESLRSAFQELPDIGEAPADILSANYEKVRCRGLFSQNIKETIAIFSRIAEYAGS